MSLSVACTPQLLAEVPMALHKSVQAHHAISWGSNASALGAEVVSAPLMPGCVLAVYRPCRFGSCSTFLSVQICLAARVIDAHREIYYRNDRQASIEADTLGNFELTKVKCNYFQAGSDFPVNQFVQLAALQEAVLNMGRLAGEAMPIVFHVLLATMLFFMLLSGVSPTPGQLLHSSSERCAQTCPVATSSSASPSFSTPSTVMSVYGRKALVRST